MSPDPSADAMAGSKGFRRVRGGGGRGYDAVSGGRGMRESAQADDAQESDGDGRRQARPARQAARPEPATTPASV